MKKTIYILAAALMAAVSCEEWEPVTTFDYDKYEEFVPTSIKANTTIAELKAMYNNGATKIEKDVIITGQVTTTDDAGNFYRSLYIQDETGGIEIKIGKSYMSNDYQMGQWLVVKCSGLTLGKYGGMLQLGYEDPSGSYETAYIDVQYIIDTHIFKGSLDRHVQPVVITASDLVNTSKYVGSYVEVQDVTYGNEVFTILYDASKNSIYLSGKTCGIDTWAMSENGFKAYMNAKDANGTAFAGMVAADKWQAYYDNASAYSVSQYFKCGSKDLQVRTSGYSKFADNKIPSEILGGAKVTLRGIFTVYNQNLQFLLIDDSADYVVY